MFCQGQFYVFHAAAVFSWISFAPRSGSSHRTRPSATAPSSRSAISASQASNEARWASVRGPWMDLVEHFRQHFDVLMICLVELCVFVDFLSS